MNELFHWFAGGLDARGNWTYMKLADCMGGDAFWIALTVMLDLAVATGYALIALHWSRNARTLPPSPAKSALATMRNIFVFCGMCGYLFIPIKMIYPAWRLYDFLMVILVYATWKYAWNARDLKVIYSELGRSTRLAADLAASQAESRRKSLFLNSISHDLRTPLNGMVLQTSLAREGIESGDTALAKQSLEQVEHSARVAADLLDRLLDYARLATAEERSSPTTFCLATTLRSVASSFNAMARQKDLLLSVACPADATIRTDQVKLERILNNLVNNALKFTKTGSVKIQAEQDGSAVEIHVIDTGIGISKQDCEQLFQEFFQVGNDERNGNKGFGLGLATARRLARQLGGDVVVESSPGHGSRFSVLLPGCVVAGGQRQHAAVSVQATVEAR